MGRTKAERQARMMSRIANAAFTNNPNVLGRLAQKAMAGRSAPIPQAEIDELYEGLED
ncbi:MAG: hypothetical protein AAF548_05315 [Actinomycetota bacterium]